MRFTITLFGLLLISTLHSCKKEDSSESEAYAKFRVNDKQYEFNGDQEAFFVKQMLDNNSGQKMHYTLRIHNLKEQHLYIELVSTASSSLSTGVYEYSFPYIGNLYQGYLGSCRLSSYGAYQYQEAGDNIKVTITKINNDRADGIFSAMLTRWEWYGVQPKITITEGEFRNVKIIQ
ncbi:MAG TPA: hypothetical protein VD794_13805 [Flavisolibacter sp.]|nr:hypothetical protein [Flavisolibacter sp.]